MGRLTLFPINANRFPAPVLAEFFEEPLLGIKGMSFYLRYIRNPYVGYCLHCFTSWSLRDAIANAISARVFKKFFTINMSTSLLYSSV
jgi:hypothetical protein